MTAGPEAHPIFPAGYRPCVGIMLLNPAGLVWIGRRTGSRFTVEGAETWQMPQGGIDHGESIDAAALRELHEETGISSAQIIVRSNVIRTYDLPPDLQGRALGGRYKGQAQAWVACRFAGNDCEVNLRQAGHPVEFDAWEWAPMNELVARVVPFKRAVYQSVVAEFRAVMDKP